MSQCSSLSLVSKNKDNNAFLFSQKKQKSFNGRVFEVAYKRLSLSPRDRSVFQRLLGFLIRNDKPFPYGSTALSNLTGYDRSTIFRSLNNLERVRLIRRVGWGDNRKFCRGSILEKILSTVANRLIKDQVNNKTTVALRDSNHVEYVESLNNSRIARYKKTSDHYLKHKEYKDCSSHEFFNEEKQNWEINNQAFKNLELYDSHNAAEESIKPNYRNNNVFSKESRSYENNGENSRFEEFWRLYPRRKGEVEARKIWFKCNLDSIADEIIDKLQNQVSHDEDWKAGYVFNASKYLHEKRWKDEVTVKNNVKSKEEGARKELANKEKIEATIKLEEESKRKAVIYMQKYARQGHHQQFNKKQEKSPFSSMLQSLKCRPSEKARV